MSEETTCEQLMVSFLTDYRKCRSMGWGETSFLPVGAEPLYPSTLPTTPLIPQHIFCGGLLNHLGEINKTSQRQLVLAVELGISLALYLTKQLEPFCI